MNHAIYKIRYCQKNYNDGFDFDGKGGTLAREFYPGENLGGDLHFDLSKIGQKNLPPLPKATIYALLPSMK